MPCHATRWNKTPKTLSPLGPVVDSCGLLGSIGHILNLEAIREYQAPANLSNRWKKRTKHAKPNRPAVASGSSSR